MYELIKIGQTEYVTTATSTYKLKYCPVAGALPKKKKEKGRF
jgi:hypothetical protein